MTTQDNPFSAINALLWRLRYDVTDFLGKQCVGLYVHGSLALGDFTPGRSDVDFLVVTGGELPQAMLPQLAMLHGEITFSDLPFADVLEGSYIPREALRCYDPKRAKHPALRVDGSFDVDGHGPDWIMQRHVIREKGVVLAGPAPHTLIDPVSPDAMREAARGILHDWWVPQLSNHKRLKKDHYQVYAVLTMCRSLYTVTFGDVAAKTAAAQWGQEQHPAWGDLIGAALAWREGMPFDRLNDTLDFMRYTLELV